MKDEEADQWYELGRVAYAEGLSSRFSKLAGEAYATGRQDEEAGLFRRLAKEFREEAEGMRKAYHTKYPTEQ